jgi:hypothetical protein
MRRLARRDRVVVVDKVVHSRSARVPWDGLYHKLRHEMHPNDRNLHPKKAESPFLDDLLPASDQIRSDCEVAKGQLIKEDVLVANIFTSTDHPSIDLIYDNRLAILHILTYPRYQNDTKQLCSTSCCDGRRRRRAEAGVFAWIINISFVSRLISDLV